MINLKPSERQRIIETVARDDGLTYIPDLEYGDRIERAKREHFGDGPHTEQQDRLATDFVMVTELVWPVTYQEQHSSESRINIFRAAIDNLSRA